MSHPLFAASEFALDEIDLIDIDDDDDEDDDDGEGFGSDYQYGGLFKKNSAHDHDDDDDDDDDDDEDDDEDDDDELGSDDYASLEAEIDADLYGSYGYYGFEPTKDQKADVADAFGVAVLAPAALQYETIDWVLEGVRGLVMGREEYEMASAFLDHPNIEEWNGMHPDRQTEIIKEAVWAATVPGVELQSDDVFWDNWQKRGPGWLGSLFGGGKAAGMAYLTMMTTDSWQMFKSTLTDFIPGIDVTDDQWINNLAMKYWALDKAGFPVYEWLRDSVSATATMQEMHPEVSELPSARPSPMPQVGPIVDIAPASSGMSWPKPATILGVGYAAVFGSAILGIGSK